MHACTIVARNYYAHARVLADSFLATNPGGRFTVLVLDGDVEGGTGYDVRGPFSIGIERDEVHVMAAMYGVTELATAVKPWLLRTLLEQDDAVMYLDPDIEVMTPLADVFELAREHSIVLTPHSLRPVPRDGREPSETTILRAGVYNLGFIAVGRGAGPFLDWWSERLARECIVDPDHGRFVDQRWIDLVPALFDHCILRDPGANVAWWNLSGRTVERRDGAWTVDGAPIRFFHYSGYSPRTPDLLSKYLTPAPRIQLADAPGLAELAASYGRRLTERDYDRWSGMPYGWDMTVAGQPLGPPLRSAYRRAVVHAEATGGVRPPDPFDEAGAGAFARWSASLPPEAAAPPLERMRQLLSHGPGGFFLGDERPPLTLVRRLVRRLLWPFLTREFQLYGAVVEQLEEHERRIAGVETDVEGR